MIKEIQIFDILYPQDFIRIGETDNEKYVVVTVRSNLDSADVLLDKDGASKLIAHLQEQFGI